MAHHFLIVEARFYEASADAQAEGAIRALEAAGATFDRISVPGALEIPIDLQYAETPKQTFSIPSVELDSPDQKQVSAAA